MSVVVFNRTAELAIEALPTESVDCPTQIGSDVLLVWNNTELAPPTGKNEIAVPLRPYASLYCCGVGNEIFPVSVRVLPPPVNVISEPVTVIVLGVLVEPIRENPSLLRVNRAEPETDVPDVLTENVG